MSVEGFTYGSDTSGLVWGYLFDREAGTAQPLDSASALAWLANPAGHEGRFAWLHFNLSNASSEKWLKLHTTLAEEFYDSLHQGSRSTRIELADDTLVAVINDVVHDFYMDASRLPRCFCVIRTG